MVVQRSKARMLISSGSAAPKVHPWTELCVWETEFKTGGGGAFCKSCRRLDRVQIKTLGILQTAVCQQFLGFLAASDEERLDGERRR